MTDDGDFTFYPTDLEHLDAAIAALKKGRQHTSAERVAYVRQLIEAHLREDERWNRRHEVRQRGPRAWTALGKGSEPAQAIEARRAIDSEAGVVGDESAVPNGNAPK